MQQEPEATTRIAEAAHELGFDRCAVARVEEIATLPRLREWLGQGMHGEMAWLARDPERRALPPSVVEDARSVVIVARSYFNGEPATEDPARGRISRYAWGDEYHDVMGRAIRELYNRIQTILPGASGRYYVDTGPVMEKAWAEAAGLGWIGKHTNLLSVGEGSWFFLGSIVLDAELPAGPRARDHCGSCRACIDVCPTAAIVAPYVLDARLCISYLTIELRGPIPRELRAPIGNRIFGCDECQDVCPWNRFARSSAVAREFAARTENLAPPLTELMELDEESFRERFRKSPVRRARYPGFLRNVAVALGNSRDSNAVPVLCRALGHAERLVRGHAAWALGELGEAEARQALERAIEGEADPWVRDEMTLAADRLGAIHGADRPGRADS